MDLLAVSGAAFLIGWYLRKDKDRFVNVEVNSNGYDFIVIGGGSAGCVLASRLSEDPNKTVLLVESGFDDKLEPNIKCPILMGTLPHTAIDWKYKVHSSSHKVKTQSWPRGKVLGGCSSINSMIFVRGNPNDYNNWEKLGCEGWGYEGVLPYFKKLESYEGVENKYRAKGGPIPANSPSYNYPLDKMFIQAGAEVGHKVLPDYNAEEQIGISVAQTNIGNGERKSAVSYLDPILNRSNLTIITGVHVTRIVIENNVATGIEFIRTSQSTPKIEKARAKREVILSAGAVGSPHLLLVSGIGPRSQLEKFNIPVHKDLPGVGENLRDHLCNTECWETYEDLGISEQSIGLKDVFQYKIWKTGKLSNFPINVLSFLNTKVNTKNVPDIQIHFFNGLPRPDKDTKKWVDKGSAYATFTNEYHDHLIKNFPQFGFSLVTVLLHPDSIGSLRLNSADPLIPPLINTNYLQDPKDIETLVEGSKAGRAIIETSKVFKGKIKGLIRDDTIPFPIESDEYIRDRVCNYSSTVYHPVGTCKMGLASDPMSVVDPKGRVYGIKGLRVADASIMPTLVSGNTNVPSIMVGEKISDIIKNDYALQSKL